MRQVKEVASPGKGAHEEQGGEEEAGVSLQHGGHIPQVLAAEHGSVTSRWHGQAESTVLLGGSLSAGWSHPALWDRGEMLRQGEEGGKARGSRKGWRWGTTWSRAIEPESYLRCQYRCHKPHRPGTRWEQDGRVWQSCRGSSRATSGQGKW